MKHDDYCVACGRLRPLRGGLCEPCRDAEAKRRERAAAKPAKPSRG